MCWCLCMFLPAWRESTVFVPGSQQVKCHHGPPLCSSVCELAWQHCRMEKVLSFVLYFRREGYNLEGGERTWLPPFNMVESNITGRPESNKPSTEIFGPPSTERNKRKEDESFDPGFIMVQDEIKMKKRKHFKLWNGRRVDERKRKSALFCKIFYRSLKGHWGWTPSPQKKKKKKSCKRIPSSPGSSLLFCIPSTALLHPLSHDGKRLRSRQPACGKTMLVRWMSLSHSVTERWWRSRRISGSLFIH